MVTDLLRGTSRCGGEESGGGGEENGNGGKGEEEEEVGEGCRIPSLRAIYSATAAVVGSGAPSRRLRVAACTRDTEQFGAQKILRTGRDVRTWIEVAVMSPPSWHVAS